MRWMTLPQTLAAFGLLLGGATVSAQTVPAETGSLRASGHGSLHGGGALEKTTVDFPL